MKMKINFFKLNGCGETETDEGQSSSKKEETNNFNPPGDDPDPVYGLYWKLTSEVNKDKLSALPAVAVKKSSTGTPPVEYWEPTRMSGVKYGFPVDKDLKEFNPALDEYSKAKISINEAKASGVKLDEGWYKTQLVKGDGATGYLKNAWYPGYKFTGELAAADTMNGQIGEHIVGRVINTPNNVISNQIFEIIFDSEDIGGTEIFYWNEEYKMYIMPFRDDQFMDASLGTQILWHCIAVNSDGELLGSINDFISSNASVAKLNKIKKICYEISYHEIIT